MPVDLTAFSSFTQMRRADIYKFVGNDPRTVQSIEEFQRLLSGNVPSIFSAILGTSVIAGPGLTGGGALGDGDVTLNVGAGTGITVGADTVGIADTTVTADTYGDATHVAQVTFNAQGQATGATAVALHLPNTVTFQASGGAAPGTSFDGSSHIVVDPSTLGLGTAATHAAGDFLQTGNNLSDLGSAPTARANLGLHTVTTQTGTTYTAVLADADTYIQFNNASAITFTIPPNSSVAFPVGTVIQMEQTGAGALSIAAV